MEEKTIKEYIEEGRLPSFLLGETDQSKVDAANLAAYQKICDSLHINLGTDGLSKKLNVWEFNRLYYNSAINDQVVKNNVSKTHEGVIQNYQDLLDGIDGKLKEIDGLSDEEKEYLKDDKTRMQERYAELQAERESYKKTIESSVLNNLNPLENLQVRRIDEKVVTEEKKLDKLYQKHEKLNNTKYRVKFMQDLHNRKIDRLNERIKNLQTKQGILLDKKKNIVQGNSDRLKALKDAREKKMMEREAAFNRLKEQKLDNLKNINDIKADLGTLSGEIINSKGFEKIALKFQEAKLKGDLKARERNTESINKLLNARQIAEERKRRNAERIKNLGSKIVTMIQAVPLQGGPAIDPRTAQAALVR